MKGVGKPTMTKSSYEIATDTLNGHLASNDDELPSSRILAGLIEPQLDMRESRNELAVHRANYALDQYRKTLKAQADKANADFFGDLSFPHRNIKTLYKITGFGKVLTKDLTVEQVDAIIEGIERRRRKNAEEIVELTLLRDELTARREHNLL